MEFPAFAEKVEDFISGKKSIEDEQALKDLFCSDCDFHKPGEDEELCCSCYLMLKKLLASKAITLERIRNALRG